MEALATTGMQGLTDSELRKINGGIGWAPALIIGGSFLLGVLKGCSSEKRENED